MPEIVIIIEKSGQTKVEVQGVTGPTCTNLSSFIEQALGSVTTRECKIEFYQEVTKEGQQIHGT